MSKSVSTKDAIRSPRAAIDMFIFWIVLIFGGSKAELARYYARFRLAMIILIDNDYELTQFVEQHPSLQCQTLSLGSGLTTHAIHRQGPDELWQASRRTGNSPTDKGFGSRAANADAAARITILRPDFQELAKSLPEEALLRTGGHWKGTRIDVLGSSAGSGFGGGHDAITEAFLAELTPMGRVISVHKRVLGPLTYTKVARRGRQNSASTQLTMLKNLVESSNDAAKLLVTHHLTMHEIVPLLDDVEQRTKLVLFDAVVMGCREIDRHFSLNEPNDLNDCDLGGVASSEIDMMSGIDQDALAPQVAFYLKYELKQHFDDLSPDPTLIDDLRWESWSTPQRQESLQSIADRWAHSAIDDVLAAVKRPAEIYRYRIFAQAASGGEFDLEKLNDEFSLTPTTLEEFIGRVKLLGAFGNRLGSEAAAIEEETTQLQQQIDSASATLQRDHARLHSRWGSLRRRRLEAPQDKLAALRELSEQLVQREAEAAAACRALETTLRETSHHRLTIQTIETILDGYIPRGSLVKVPSYIYTEKLSQAFPKLLRLPMLLPQERLDLLCGLAGAISAEGLAHVFHQSSDRLDDLARTIVQGTYDIQGPPHGAWMQQHHPRPIFALPPMEPETEKKLRKAILTQCSGAKVVFYDTLMFGVTAARIRMRRFNQAGDLFLGLPGRDLLVAMNDPLAALNSIDGFAGVEFFGGQITGDRVVFPSSEGTPAPADDEDDGDAAAGAVVAN